VVVNFRAELNPLRDAVDSHAAEPAEPVEVAEFDEMLVKAVQAALRPVAQELRRACDEILMKSHLGAQKSRKVMERMLRVTESLDKNAFGRNSG
jgi:hypothetical protein